MVGRGKGAEGAVKRGNKRYKLPAINHGDGMYSTEKIVNML